MAFVQRMVPGDDRDPLLKQVFPQPEEDLRRHGYGADPVGESAFQRAPGLLQKYKGRALLVVTGACPVHCRYCFRRHFPYEDSRLGGAGLEAAVSAIRRDPSITEVILSGGDPLSLSNARLVKLTAQLTGIPHVQRLRVHTRFPVVQPDRVDEGFVEWLHEMAVPVVVVLHSNHPREIDGGTRQALLRMRNDHTLLLNQSVLLRDINDDVDSLVELSERLFQAGVLPYYLHQLDPVDGAAHFQVGDARARAIVRAVSARLPGYLVPRLVREVPGMPAKTPLEVGLEPTELELGHTSG